MSDNPTPGIDTIERLARAYAHDADGTLPQPPAPHISEEEIQLLTGKLYIGLVNEPIYTWHEKCAAILRTLNEVK